jgi:hypothetical protein
MQYATTSGERSVSELVTRLYGVGERTAAGRSAARALREANPELEEIAELPHGSVVEVPEVEGAEPAEPLADLTGAIGVAALGSVKSGLDSLKQVLEDVVRDRVQEATEARKLIGSADVKRAAREDPALAATLKSASAQTEAELEEARALRTEQRKALEKLAEDLDALLEVVTAPPEA